MKLRDVHFDLEEGAQLESLIRCHSDLVKSLVIYQHVDQSHVDLIVGDAQLGQSEEGMIEHIQQLWAPRIWNHEHLEVVFVLVFNVHSVTKLESHQIIHAGKWIVHDFNLALNDLVIVHKGVGESTSLFNFHGLQVNIEELVVKEFPHDHCPTINNRVLPVGSSGFIDVEAVQVRYILYFDVVCNVDACAIIVESDRQAGILIIGDESQEPAVGFQFD